MGLTKKYMPKSFKSRDVVTWRQCSYLNGVFIHA